MKQKTCPICGKAFLGYATAKYCSAECSEIGRKQKRKAWEDSHDYIETQRVKRLNKRREAEQSRVDVINQRQDKLSKDNAERVKADRLLMEQKAEAGDLYSLMVLAHERNDKKSYWRYYAQSEIEAAEKYGRKSTRLVNDYSVYEPDFPDLVLESIKLTGKCIQRLSAPLGEAIDTQNN